MKKIRINELARECEQPNSAVLALLSQFGVTEKKTHSSSVDDDVADQIRRHFGIVVERPAVAEPEAPAAEAAPGPEVVPDALSAAPADSSVHGESDTIEDAGSSSEQV